MSLVPKFSLAHVTENNDGVTGYIWLREMNARRAGFGDLASLTKCFLEELHRLGTAHGSAGALRVTHLSSRMTAKNTRALFHNFGGSFQTDDQTALDAELERPGGCLVGRR